MPVRRREGVFFISTLLPTLLLSPTVHPSFVFFIDNAMARPAPDEVPLSPTSLRPLSSIKSPVDGDSRLTLFPSILDHLIRHPPNRCLSFSPTPCWPAVSPRGSVYQGGGSISGLIALYHKQSTAPSQDSPHSPSAHTHTHTHTEREREREPRVRACFHQSLLFHPNIPTLSRPSIELHQSFCPVRRSERLACQLVPFPGLFHWDNELLLLLLLLLCAPPPLSL
ncbi:hypothetical protein CTA2_1221 [Colletotrichum tanaceti]|nr:hypothetical protein CTA2_1221 [Colletotrichum tanaceti]